MSSKTIRQAYAATIIGNDGKPVPPGTAITLPADEADRLREAFGVVATTETSRRSRGASVERRKLEEEVKARADHLTAAAEAAEKDASVANLEALLQAERDLVIAEAALASAED